MLSLDWHHRNLLQCVENVLPSTARGVHFQQVLAINVAIKLIDKQPDDDEEIEDSVEQKESKEEEYKLRLNFPVKVTTKIRIFQG